MGDEVDVLNLLKKAKESIDMAIEEIGHLREEIGHLSKVVRIYEDFKFNTRGF